MKKYISDYSTKKRYAVLSMRFDGPHTKRKICDCLLRKDADDIALAMSRFDRCNLYTSVDNEKGTER